MRGCGPGRPIMLSCQSASLHHARQTLAMQSRLPSPVPWHEILLRIAPERPKGEPNAECSSACHVELSISQLHHVRRTLAMQSVAVRLLSPFPWTATANRLRLECVHMYERRTTGACAQLRTAYSGSVSTCTNRVQQDRVHSCDPLTIGACAYVRTAYNRIVCTATIRLRLERVHVYEPRTTGSCAQLRSAYDWSVCTCTNGVRQEHVHCHSTWSALPYEAPG